MKTHICSVSRETIFIVVVVICHILPFYIINIDCSDYLCYNMKAIKSISNYTKS